MPLSKKVRIFHANYDLVPVDTTFFAVEGKYGQIVYLTKTINYLNTDDSEMVDTVVHELLHGIWRYLDLNFGLKDGMEEHIVSALASGITELMKDNPKLFKDLIGILEKDK